jgi:hypothetical protein
MEVAQQEAAGLANYRWRCNLASERLNNGFQRWIAERNVDVESGNLEWYRTYTVIEGNYGLNLECRDLNIAEKIFGRNIDEFLAYRIGAFVAVVFRGVSIWAAIDAGDPWERSADSLMAAAAGLDLIAAVAGWALTAAEVSAATVATICSAIGFLGILAALAGIALLLYMIFRPQKNPVQQFTSNYARPAGFFMPYGSEIDHFTGYVQDGVPQRMGCPFVVNASTSPETVLSVANDSTTVEAAAQSFGCDSVFVISTNGTGQSRILALVQNESGVLQTKVLTWASDKSVSFQLSFGPSDQNYNTQLWTIAMEGPPQMDGVYPESAVFSATASGTSNALVWNGTSLCSVPERTGRSSKCRWQWQGSRWRTSSSTLCREASPFYRPLY